MTDDELYSCLRSFTSPVVAITTRSGDDLNGMIANSAVRASLVPERPRIAFYCFKKHYSHGLIAESGEFCLHLLQDEQFGLIRNLGFESGRDTNKMESVDFDRSENGLPVLSDVAVYFDCQVVNSMDAGPSTFYMGEVRIAEKHRNYENLNIMTSDYFRKNMPEDWKDDYERNKKAFQEWAKDHMEIDGDRNETS